MIALATSRSCHRTVPDERFAAKGGIYLNQAACARAAPRLEIRVIAAAGLARRPVGPVDSAGYLWHDYIRWAQCEQFVQVDTNLRWYRASVLRGVIAPLHDLAQLLREAINSDDTVLLQLERARAVAGLRINGAAPAVMRNACMVPGV